MILYILFYLKDNSVNLHECSPFGEGTFIIYCKENLLIYKLFDVDMRILIGKARYRKV